MVGGGGGDGSFPFSFSTRYNGKGIDEGEGLGIYSVASNRVHSIKEFLRQPFLPFSPCQSNCPEMAV